MNVYWWLKINQYKLKDLRELRDSAELSSKIKARANTIIDNTHQNNTFYTRTVTETFVKQFKKYNKKRDKKFIE